MLIPIFYRRGSVWGAGAAVVPFKSPTAWVLHAWSPNVRPDRRTGIPCKRKKKMQTHVHVFINPSKKTCFNYTCSGLFFTHRRRHISRNIITKKQAKIGCCLVCLFSVFFFLVGRWLHFFKYDVGSWRDKVIQEISLAPKKKTTSEHLLLDAFIFKLKTKKKKKTLTLTLLWNHHYMSYQVCTTFKNIARGELVYSHETPSYKKKRRK